MQGCESSESALTVRLACELHAAITALESVLPADDRHAVAEADAALGRLGRAGATAERLAEVRRLEALLWVSLTRAADRCSALADRLAELEEWATPAADVPSARSAVYLARRLRRKRGA